SQAAADRAFGFLEPFGVGQRIFFSGRSLYARPALELIRHEILDVANRKRKQLGSPVNCDRSVRFRVVKGVDAVPDQTSRAEQRGIRGFSAQRLDRKPRSEE